MPETMNGNFLQNMLALMQMRQQAAQFQQTMELNRQQQQAQALQTLAGMTQGFADRGAALDFGNATGTQLGISPDAILALARGQAPSETSIRGEAARRGREAAGNNAAQNAEAASVVSTGMGGAQAGMSQFLASQLGRMTEGAPRQVANMLGEAGILRMLTNQTPGQFSLDQATHNMQPEQLNQAARMNLGLELTPAQMASNSLIARGQDLNYSTGMASNRLGWAQLAQQGELGMLGLQMQSQLALLQSTGKSGLQINDIPEMIAIQNNLMEQLGKAQTPAAKQQLEASVGTINSLLNSLGVPTPQITPGSGQMTPVGGFGGLLPWNWNNRTTLPMYDPRTAPAQQQGAQNLMNPQPFRFGMP